MKKLVFLFAVTLLFASFANASLIPALVGSPVPTGPNFAFNYQAMLTNTERLDVNATNGVTCPGPSNTKVQCNPAGTFFTIYDIPGFVSASGPGAPWVEAMQ